MRNVNGPGSAGTPPFQWLSGVRGFTFMRSNSALAKYYNVSYKFCLTHLVAGNGTAVPDARIYSRE